MRHVARFAGFVLIAVLGAACGSSAAPATTAPPTTVAPDTTVSSTSTSPGTTAPSTSTTQAIPEVPAAGTPVTEIGNAMVAELEVRNDPDVMVWLDGYLWLRTGDGILVKIDPSGNTVVAEVEVDTTIDPYHGCNGIGTDGTHIWSCSSRGGLDRDAPDHSIDVVRFDPTTLQVIDTYQVDKLVDQLELPFSDNRIWVLTGIGEQLVGIDVDTGEISGPVELGTRCFQLAAGEGAVYATCVQRDLVLRVDVPTLTVSGQASVKGADSIAVDDEGVWVGQATSVVRLDPDTLEPVARFTGLRRIYDIDTDAEGVWVRVDGEDFVYRIDPATNQFAEVFRLNQPMKPGTIQVTPDAIWATAFDEWRVRRFER